jgi:hypothetical protein
VPENGQNPPPARPPVLAKEEASRRAALLADLQAALAAHGVPSVLARRHRLVLSGASTTTCALSGPTDPELHIFLPDGKDIATTRGRSYHFASGHAHPADDPAQAARRYKHRAGHHHPAPAAQPAPAARPAPAGHDTDGT